mmetsp:Transcript_76105/g.215675  ORF Transcript_76105/g.215675 Transcript_76105/m.215675 type:complete len:208 (-) Transcript_76105:70-693(-)
MSWPVSCWKGPSKHFANGSAARSSALRSSQLLSEVVSVKSLGSSARPSFALWRCTSSLMELPQLSSCLAIASNSRRWLGERHQSGTASHRRIAHCASVSCRDACSTAAATASWAASRSSSSSSPPSSLSLIAVIGERLPRGMLARHFLAPAGASDAPRARVAPRVSRGTKVSRSVTWQEPEPADIVPTNSLERTRARIRGMLLSNWL